jgi:hypothetical protein
LSHIGIGASTDAEVQRDVGKRDCDRDARRPPPVASTISRGPSRAEARGSSRRVAQGAGAAGPLRRAPPAPNRTSRSREEGRAHKEARELISVHR